MWLGFVLGLGKPSYLPCSPTLRTTIQPQHTSIPPPTMGYLLAGLLACRLSCIVSCLDVSCLRCAIVKTAVVALASFAYLALPRSTTAQVLSCLILHHLVSTYHQFCWSWSWSWSWLVSSLYLMFSIHISEAAKTKVFSYLGVPLSGLVLSCFVLSCLVLSCFVLSCPVLSCLVLSCLIFLHWRVLSWPNFSCLVLSCLLC